VIIVNPLSFDMNIVIYVASHKSKFNQKLKISLYFVTLPF